MFTREQFIELSFEQKKEVMGLKAKFHEKKTKATSEMERIKKNGWNDFHKYHYARESDVKDQIREILKENKLDISSDLISRNDTVVQTKQGQATKTEVIMEFTITDCETGYFEPYRLDGVTIDNSDKGVYKAYSNTIKYFMMNQFLIPTGDDVESGSAIVDNKQQNKSNGPRNNPPQQPNRSSNPPSSNRQPSSNNTGGSGQAKDTWRKVMDAEDVLGELTGRKKYEIRTSLEHQFGKLEKYKEMDEDKAVAVLKTLNGWVEKYRNPEAMVQS